MNIDDKKIRENLNRQFKQYFKDYWFLHEKHRSPKELLDIQFSINEVINECSSILSQYKKKYSHLKMNKEKEIYDSTIHNLEFVINIYHLLVDDIIIKYICEGDCSLFAQLIDGLNTKNSNNTNYDYKNVFTYLNIAKNQLVDDETYVVVCDLSSKRLKCGDVVLYTKGKMDYIELKKYSKDILKFLKLVISNGSISKLNKHDKEYVNRLLKQMNKHRELDFNYGNPIDDPSTRRFFEFNPFAEIYLGQIKNDMKKMSNVNYIENKVDNCISYLIIKNDKKIVDRNFDSIIAKYIPNGINIYTYNEFMFDSVISRPFQLNWGKRLYKKLLRSQIVIFIKIDLKQLFQEFRKKIPFLKMRKALLEDYQKTPLYIIGNQMVYFNTSNGPFYIGKIIMFSIASCLYTSKSAVDYYYNSILKYHPEALEMAIKE